MPQPPSDAPAPHHAGGIGIFLGLVPWVLFTIIAEHGTLTVAAVGALVIAAGICLYALRDGGRPKMIELAAVVCFAVFTVVAIVADPSLSHWLTRYARAIASAVLAVLVFGSLLFTPFTAPYARESVPERYWSSPQFVETNRRLTALWGGVFAVMTGCHVIAGAADSRLTNVVFNWAVPIWLILYGVRHSRPSGETSSARQAA